ncbi:hypothetical protein EDB81DRAFT_668902 [Dactylonectria macrodidyma]|uniref:Uncharacterized protein n=1 Tax=Dactylonectria macrodidyma TaxID=307937 RepID=A0A9P9DAL3_9HYPO|nr:hypothetical protein EDB81DRAFT_668902 [Dactylonectria macrodidyma]
MLVLHDLPLSSTKHRSLQKPHRSNERPGDDTQHVAKKRKLDHPSRPPPHFWDSLSQLELTKNALRELDRRNTEEPRYWPEDRYRRPCTRRAVAARRKTQRPSAQEFLHQSSPADRARLRRFARHGGPELNDLRGFRQPSNPKMSPSQSSLGRRKRGSQSPSKSNTTTTRSTGPYDRAFQQHLIDHNIFPDGYEYPDGRIPPEPENIDEIRQVLEQPRASLSPSRFSKEDFRKFKRADAHATKESRVTASVIPIIEGDPGDTKCVASDVPFTNLDHLTDGSLVCAKPDLYYGARPEQLHRKVREELSNLIVPSTQDDLPVAPNNFVEVKGPDGSLSVATRQALYDVTLGSRGLHSLQAYGTAEPRYDNNAYALAWTYHGGTLKAYANHPIQPSTPGAHPGYVMTQIKGWSLTSDPETFRQGAAAYRNGRDWTKLQRNQAIAQANDKVASLESTIDSQNNLSRLAREMPRGDTMDATSQVTNKDLSLPLCYDPDTSEDELSLDFGHPIKRSRSPEKQASTTESIQNQHDPDQRGKGVSTVSKPNAFRDGRKFNLTPANRAQDDITN